MSKPLSLVSKKFGLLTVIKRVENDKFGKAHWLCQCDCGNKSVVCGSQLVSGKTQSCGCKQKIAAAKNGRDNRMKVIKDLTGKKFGRLVVIKPSDHKKPNNSCCIWECLCDCGTTTYVPTNSLTLHHTKSCGCLQKEIAKGSCKKRKILIGNIPQTYYKSVKRGAKDRGIEFNITPEYIDKLLVQQNFICALSGQRIGFEDKDYKRWKETWTASLDRIDSSMGYVIDNVQWVHKDVNFMKQDWDDIGFINLCYKVTDYQRGKRKQ